MIHSSNHTDPHCKQFGAFQDGTRCTVNRKAKNARVAQLVEQPPCKGKVEGSNPSFGTNNKRQHHGFLHPIRSSQSHVLSHGH